MDWIIVSAPVPVQDFGLWILDFGLGLDNNINTFLEKLPVLKNQILKFDILFECNGKPIFINK